MVESVNGTDTATSFPQRGHQGLWCHRVVWSITEFVSSTPASVYMQLPKYVLTVACLNMQGVQVMCWEKVGSLSKCLKVRDLAARSRRERVGLNTVLSLKPQQVSFYGIKLRVKDSTKWNEKYLQAESKACSYSSLCCVVLSLAGACWVP